MKWLNVDLGSVQPRPIHTGILQFSNFVKRFGSDEVMMINGTVFPEDPRRPQRQWGKEPFTAVLKSRGVVKVDWDCNRIKRGKRSLISTFAVTHCLPQNRSLIASTESLAQNQQNRSQDQ